MLAKLESRKKLGLCWRTADEPPEACVRREQSAQKTMFSVFFRSSGLVHVAYLDKGMTVDSKFNIENCLGPAFERIKQQRPKSGLHGIKLLHDNARPHVHSDVDSFIRSQGVIIIDHLPYSSDLAPSDYWLFDMVKSQLGVL